MTADIRAFGDPVRLAVSVGGSKCAFAVVRASHSTILARSRRLEWTGLGISSFPAFVAMMAREFKLLCADAGINADQVAEVGVAWPGPSVGAGFLATFIPGCAVAQPLPLMLQRALAKAIAPRFATVPVHVALDAVARAVGESTPGGAFSAPFPEGPDLLVNIATGIAAGLARHGRAVWVHERFGANYGQVGRFLLLNRATSTWDWRPTLDGSVPRHTEEEVRWTELSAGPALARRIADWCADRSVDAAEYPEVARALHHYGSSLAPRDAVHEKTLLRWVTVEASHSPGGVLSEFVASIAKEIGGALRVLLDVLAPMRVRRVALAGGVGENFGLRPSLGTDPFLHDVGGALGRGDCFLCRARLGVDAEFLGLGGLEQLQDSNVGREEAATDE